MNKTLKICFSIISINCLILFYVISDLKINIKKDKVELEKKKKELDSLFPGFTETRNIDFHYNLNIEDSTVDIEYFVWYDGKIIRSGNISKVKEVCAKDSVKNLKTLASETILNYQKFQEMFLK